MVDLSELKMNVAALKRVDPYIKDILETATHVALYSFNAEHNEWERTDIEGALFVYSRNGEPYNSILIMNRLNTNNLVEPVTQRLDLELQEPFLLYRNSKSNIHGIWFYDKEDCTRIATTLKQLIKHGDKDMSIKSKKQILNKTTLDNNVDIFSMLSKAQENFNINRVNNENNSQSQSVSDNSFTNISSYNALFDVTSQSVVDFFNKAKVNTQHHQHYKAIDHRRVVNESKPLSLARLMSNPAAHTVEHIEKQQRSVTPQPSAAAPSKIPPAILPIDIINNGTPISKIKREISCNESMSILNSPQMIDNQDNNESTSSFLRIQSPMSLLSQNDIIKNIPTAEQNFDHINITKRAEITPIKTLPMSFSSLVLDSKEETISSKISGNGGSANVGVRGSTSIVNSSNPPALIPPVMFFASSPSESSNRPTVEPLTKIQLLQAFNYLLKHDSDFMNKLHEAYVKSFSEILS